jgi:deazaflavin-dependent oxidoreductase (nitroreductase family)
MIGRRFLVLTATGRKSGQPRRAALEYTVMDGKLYIVSAWGERAQWYRNVVADPHVTVQTHAGAAGMVARRVDDDAELARLFERFRHSPVWDIYLDALCIERDAADFVAKKDRLYLLRLDSTGTPTPPPLEPDLEWVWWVVLALGVMALARRWLRSRRVSGGE